MQTLEATDLEFYRSKNSLFLDEAAKWNRAMIIEDDISLYSVIEAILEEINPDMEIEWFTRAEDATLYLRRVSDITGQSNIDVVIADIFLEGQATGLDVWRLCKSNFENAQVIVTSAIPRSKFLNLIASETDLIPPPFLEKPFSIKECKDTLEEYMNY